MQSLKCETRVTTFLRPNSRYKPITFNPDFNVKKIAVINSVQIVECLIHAHKCPKRSSRLRPLRHHKFHNGYGRWCNIGLCDSRDYFAGPLLLVQNKFNLTVT